MLDLNDIAMFVQVVRSGSFAAAGRRLGLPSNTVSRRVQDLEEKPCTRLLKRFTRKLTLTSAGEAFHERCADAVDGLNDAGHELITGARSPTGWSASRRPPTSSTSSRWSGWPASWPSTRSQVLRKAALATGRFGLHRGGDREDERVGRVACGPVHIAVELAGYGGSIRHGQARPRIGTRLKDDQ